MYVLYRRRAHAQRAVPDADAFDAFIKFTRVSRAKVSSTNNGVLRIAKFKQQPGRMGQW